MTAMTTAGLATGLAQTATSTTLQGTGSASSAGHAKCESPLTAIAVIKAWLSL